MGPLSCLLALQLLLPMTSPAAPPPPPTISVAPEKREYVIGDTVLVRCDAPPALGKVQGFQFLGTSGWAVEVRTTKRSYTLPVNLMSPRDGGAHSCTYTLRSRQLLHSQESRTIIINVKDRPPRPTLALSSSNGLAIEGQPLVFSCLAPPGEAERRFHFYKEDVEVIDDVAVTSRDSRARLEVAASGRNHTGNFTCGYEEKTEGRWVASYPSPARRVLVREVTPPPLLTVDPPGGRVVQGHPLVLTCVATRGDFRPRFRFFRNGEEMPPPVGPPKPPGEPPGEPSGPSEPPKTPVEPPKTPSEPPKTPVEPPKTPSEPPKTPVEPPKTPSEPPKTPVEPPGPPVEPSKPPSEPPQPVEPPVEPSKPPVEPSKPPVEPAGPPGKPPKPPAEPPAPPVEPAAEGPGGPQGRFLLPRSPPGFGGSFSCRVEEEVGGAWVVSAPSAAVEVTIEAPFPLIPLAAGGAAGGVASLLGLLLALRWRRRRRGDWRGLHNKEDPGALPMVPVT